MKKLKRVEIKNILGVKEIAFDAGAVTVIHGGNGVGKTSVIDAISSVFEGGHDAGLIRNGAESGTVTLTLDDGTVIKKVIKEKASTLEVRTPDGGMVKAPATWVKKLAASFAFDPVALIDAPPKERAKALLEAMPVEFAPDEVNEAMSEALATAVVRGAFVRPMSLDDVNQLRAGLYEDRRKTRAMYEQVDATVARLRASLPEEDGIDVAAEESKASAKLDNLRHELVSIRTTIKTEADKLRAEALAEYNARIQEIDREQAAAIEKEAAEINGDIERVTAEVSTLRAKLKEAERAGIVRQEIERQEKEAKEKGANVFALDRAVQAIDALKIRKMSELPIPGVDIRDGEIWIDGVEWSHVNTARQYAVCCQIANLMTGELPLIVIDRAESMDDQQFDQLKEAAAGVGLQVVAARVDAGPLKVTQAA